MHLSWVSYLLGTATGGDEIFMDGYISVLVYDATTQRFLRKKIKTGFNLHYGCERRPR